MTDHEIMEPFVRSGDVVQVHLSASEIGVLEDLPELIAREGELGGRFAYRTHPDDAGAEARYRELIGGDLDRLRAADRASFATRLGSSEITLEAAEAWMRVVGEARVVLAARLGIEEDGWDEDVELGGDPEMALLGYLGYLQESLVGVLG